MSKLAASLCTVTAFAAFAGVAQAADLTIDIGGVRDAKGKVMVALHAPQDGIKFPDFAGAIAAQWQKASPGTIRFVFPGLQPGRYAIAVYHDENNNDALDSNALGVPTEGYAFSREAKGFMGPPSFDDAAVEIAASPLSTTATLSY